MLSDRRAHAVLPTSDIQRLRPFYEDTLGLKPVADAGSIVIFSCGLGSVLAISETTFKPGGHTQVVFTVPDLEAEMAELAARGVTFEEYDKPRTQNGIARMVAGRAAWMKDPDSNLVALVEFDEPF